MQWCVKDGNSLTESGNNNAFLENGELNTIVCIINSSGVYALDLYVPLSNMIFSYYMLFFDNEFTASIILIAVFSGL